MSDDVVEKTDVSLVTGRLRCTVTKPADGDHGDAVVQINEQMIIANNSASTSLVTLLLAAVFVQLTHLTFV